jgi:choloylglycine hydrolase
MNYACTTFALITDSKQVFGRNLDVENDIGKIFINPKDKSKVAYFSSKSSELPAKWTSKYGSVTFNQISMDIPHGGMNENGLVIEHLFLEESKHEPFDDRPALISHQWVQYMLDCCSDVQEVIIACTKVRISNSDYKFPIHFHLMDKKGNRAIIEYLDGEMVLFQNESYKIGVLANSTYANSLLNIDKSNSYNSDKLLPTDISNSLNRFSTASDMLNNYAGQELISYGFSILDAVYNDTQWQIIYDLQKLEIRYRTHSFRDIRVLKLTDFEFHQTKEATCNRKITMSRNRQLVM